MLHYWIDWLKESGRIGHIWRSKKSIFMMTFHHLTHRILHWQKSMNWVCNGGILLSFSWQSSTRCFSLSGSKARMGVDMIKTDALLKKHDDRLFSYKIHASRRLCGGCVSAHVGRKSGTAVGSSPGTLHLCSVAPCACWASAPPLGWPSPSHGRSGQYRWSASWVGLRDWLNQWARC